MKKPTVLLLLAVFVLGCAKKRRNAVPATTGPLPAATQKGANVLACYLDTTPYIIQDDGNPLDFEAGADSYTFFISGCPPPFITYWQALHFLELEVYYGDKVGVPYAANDTFHVKVEYEVDSACYYIGYDDIDVLACGGSVTLTKFDQANRIVSGVFDAKFAIPGCDTVTMSDGRFDFSY